MQVKSCCVNQCEGVPLIALLLPSFLLTCQGSTELWEWDQQLASEAFKIHDRLLRQYMTHFFGYEVSTEGDAFLVAFHEPFDAVAWCLCVQMALHSECLTAFEAAAAVC
jgi:class 3 adenylate cyclase